MVKKQLVLTKFQWLFQLYNTYTKKFASPLVSLFSLNIVKLNKNTFILKLFLIKMQLLLFFSNLIIVYFF